MLPMFVSALVIQMAPPVPPPRKKVEEKQNPQTEVEEGGECWVQLAGLQGVPNRITRAMLHPLLEVTYTGL